MFVTKKEQPSNSTFYDIDTSVRVTMLEFGTSTVGTFAFGMVRVGTRVAR
jgi:hypothetical protein